MSTLTNQFNAFDKDMKILKKNLRELGFLDRPVGFIIFSWTLNLVLAIVPAFAFFYVESWWLKGVCAVLAGMGSVGIATCSHNASHGNSFKSATVNQFMDIFGFSFIIGISSAFWDNFHNKLHHPNTSIISIDPDTNILPWFVLHEKQLEKATPMAKIYYKYQWIAFPVLVGFYVNMLQVMGWKFLFRKFSSFSELDSKTQALYIIEVIALVGHYVFWIGLFWYYFPLLDILVLYIARFFVSGVLCFFALAPTHYVRDALYFDEDILKVNYYSRQMFSTVNFRVGFLGTLVNGVEYHLDHHLFPQVSPSLLKSLGREIEKIARKHGMPYRSRSWLSIIADSYRVIIKPKVVDNSLIQNYVTKPARAR
ncbi:MAG: fatty acid desaturase [Spirochaetia bacterium]|nr:fatty acid desaturase [Spirochaetia bacterium]